MWVFPLVASVVAAMFAMSLLQRFIDRRRPYQLAWAASLAMYAAGSAALTLGVIGGWSRGEYQLYWALGAVLNVPYLALGEVYLIVGNRRVGDVTLFVLLFATGFAASRIRTAAMDLAALDKDLPLGKDVFTGDAFSYRLAQLYAYPAYLFLVGGCVWSFVRMRGKRELRDRSLGTLGIAAGATIVAIGSGVGAGLNVVPVFSIGLLLGIVVMFWGFLRASKPPAAVPGTVHPEGDETPPTE